MPKSLRLNKKLKFNPHKKIPLNFEEQNFEQIFKMNFFL